MKNAQNWKPTKFVVRGGRLRASRDSAEVGVGSRLIADLVAALYERAIAQHAKGRLLDLGCGKAPLYAIYNRFVKESVCVDWGNSLHKNPHLDFECDLTRPLPFTDSEFDTVILSDVLEHIPEAQQLCAEIQRILRPGGILLLNVPFYYWLHEEPFDFYRYTKFSLQRLLERPGFDLLELEEVGGAPEILTDIVAKLLVCLPAVGRYPAALLQWITACVRRTSWGLRLSNRTAKKFPLGYFVVARRNVR